jgi:hypothetical protein
MGRDGSKQLKLTEPMSKPAAKSIRNSFHRSSFRMTRAKLFQNAIPCAVRVTIHQTRDILTADDYENH